LDKTLTTLNDLIDEKQDSSRSCVLRYEQWTRFYHFPLPIFLLSWYYSSPFPDSMVFLFPLIKNKLDEPRKCTLFFRLLFFVQPEFILVTGRIYFPERVYRKNYVWLFYCLIGLLKSNWIVNWLSLVWNINGIHIIPVFIQPCILYQQNLVNLHKLQSFIGCIWIMWLLATFTTTFFLPLPLPFIIFYVISNFSS
jgi:hypothetical protein